MRVVVPTGEQELVSSRLWSFQTTGIAEHDRAGGEVELVSGFDTEASARAAADALPTAFDRSVEWADDRAWFDPERTTVLDVAGRRLSLRPGPAFGDGHHPTTRLALDLMAELVRPGDRVVDLGTGTGILALAAAALGADGVIAVENDLDALGVARQNVDRHRELAGAITVTDRLPPTAPVDLAVVNVLLDVHLELGARLVACLRRPGGTMIASGLLTAQEDRAAAAYLPLSVADRRTAGGDWLSLVLR